MESQIIFSELKLTDDAIFKEFIGNLNCWLKEYQFGDYKLSVFHSSYEKQYSLFFKIEENNLISSYHSVCKVVTITTKYPFQLEEIIPDEDEIKFVLAPLAPDKKKHWVKFLINALVISQNKKLVDEDNRFESLIGRLTEADLFNPNLIDTAFDLEDDYDDSTFNFEIEFDGFLESIHGVNLEYYPYIKQFIVDKCLTQFGYYASIWNIRHRCYKTAAFGFKGYIKQLIIVVKTPTKNHIYLSPLRNDIEIDDGKTSRLLSQKESPSEINLFFNYKNFDLNEKFKTQNSIEKEMILTKNGIQLI